MAGMNSPHKALLGMMCLAAVGMGCNEPSNDAAQDPIGSVRSELSGCPPYNLETVWAQNGGKVALRPYNTHFCWLTKVGGNFVGTKSDSGIVVEAHPNDGYWWLETHGASEYGEATCTPLSCFVGDGIDDVRWSSAGTNFGALATATSCCCDSQQMPTWWGDAATVLQSHPATGGWAGRTEGGGEYSLVSQSWNAVAPSSVKASDCHFEGSCCKGIHATATSLFVGTPSSGKTAHFAGAWWVNSNYTVAMANAAQTICYLTKISGQFRGGGESVRIWEGYDMQQGIYRWYMTASHGSASTGV